MNDLYLIGNGFDLAHGLKTSYNDFLLWYLNSSLRQYNKDRNYMDGLIEIRHNGSYKDYFEDFISISDLFKWCKESDYYIKPQFMFFNKLLSSIRNYKWVDIEYDYYAALVDFYKRLEKSNITRNDGIDKELESLNNCFDFVKKKLSEYLKIIDGVDRIPNGDIENILFEGMGSDKKLFVYFNYTTTLEMYTKLQLLEIRGINDTVYIHGKLGDKSNPIIFGYGDEMDPYYEKIEHLNTNEFLKNIKSFGYFRTTNYQKVIRFVGSGDFRVKILGHSCGLSDRILLNTVFEHPNCKAIKIYYYQKSETENDYFEKTQEISRHFKASGKGNMRAKIVSFDESVPLVPFVTKN